VGTANADGARGDLAQAVSSAGLSRRAFLSLLGLSAVAACSGTSLPTFTFPRNALYYGAGMPPDDLAPFESQLGQPLPCFRRYFEAGEEASLVAQIRGDLDAGRMPIPSIKPPGPWAQSARDNGWIDGVLEPLGELDEPIFLSVHHEPENDAAGYGTAAEFKQLQNAVLSRAATHARNVIVVPILSTWSFDERSKRRPSEWNVTDAPVYGLDLYNPWSATNGKDWVSFEDKLSLAEQEADGRPMLIGEYGCRSDPAQPGRAAQWMRDAFEVALEGSVVAMAYFNSYRNSPDGTWELDAETYPVFAELVTGPGVARI
jgi:hypothetical protein